MATPAPQKGSKWGYVNRVNRVPHFQHVFQAHDGLRQWEKTPRTRIFVMPFKVTMYTTLAFTLYAMGRLTLGHKTWWGPG